MDKKTAVKLDAAIKNLNIGTPTTDVLEEKMSNFDKNIPIQKRVELALMVDLVAALKEVLYLKTTEAKLKASTLIFEQSKGRVDKFLVKLIAGEYGAKTYGTRIDAISREHLFYGNDDTKKTLIQVFTALDYKIYDVIALNYLNELI